MRILIVDDDFVSRRLLIKYLENKGKCDIACNGREAWEAFQFAHKEDKPYNLILMDILMPEMDGRQALRLIREFESKQGLAKDKKAVIAMATTLADKDSVIQSFHDQCDGYITKPYSHLTLLKSLNKFQIF